MFTGSSGWLISLSLSILFHQSESLLLWWLLSFCVRSAPVYGVYDGIWCFVLFLRSVGLQQLGREKMRSLFVFVLDWEEKKSSVPPENIRLGESSIIDSHQVV